MTFRRSDLYHIWSEEEKERIFKSLTEPLHCPDFATPASKRADSLKARREFYQRRSLFPVIWIQMLWALSPKETSLLRSEHWNPSANFLMLTTDITSNGRARAFTVDRVTAALLNGLTNDLEPHDPVFRAANGKRWNTATMSRQFKDILRKLRLSGSLYSCRFYAIRTLMHIMPGQLRLFTAITGHNIISLVAGSHCGASRQLSAREFYEMQGDDGLRWLKASNMELPTGLPSVKVNALKGSDDPEGPEDLGPATTDSGSHRTSPPSTNAVSEDE